GLLHGLGNQLIQLVLQVLGEVLRLRIGAAARQVWEDPVVRVVEVLLPAKIEEGQATVGLLLEEGRPGFGLYIYLELGVDLAQAVLEDFAAGLALVVAFVVDVLDREARVPQRLAIGGFDGSCLELVGGLILIEAVVRLVGIVTQHTVYDLAKHRFAFAI